MNRRAFFAVAVGAATLSRVTAAARPHGFAVGDYVLNANDGKLWFVDRLRDDLRGDPSCLPCVDIRQVNGNGHCTVHVSRLSHVVAFD